MSSLKLENSCRCVDETSSICEALCDDIWCRRTITLPKLYKIFLSFQQQKWERHLIFIICREKTSSDFTYIWYIPNALFLLAISRAWHLQGYMRESDCNLLFKFLSIAFWLLFTVSALTLVFQLNDTSAGHVHFMTRGAGGYAVVLAALLAWFCC